MTFAGLLYDVSICSPPLVREMTCSTTAEDIAIRPTHGRLGDMAFSDHVGFLLIYAIPDNFATCVRPVFVPMADAAAAG